VITNQRRYLETLLEKYPKEEDQLNIATAIGFLDRGEKLPVGNVIAGGRMMMSTGLLWAPVFVLRVYAKEYVLINKPTS
jgi:hypothetical protein